MARLAHKAGVLCIMLTIKDSISSLILFTSPMVAWVTSCSINTVERKEREGNTDADLTSIGQIKSLPSQLMRMRGKHGCSNMHLSLEQGDKGAILICSILSGK